MFKFYLWLMGVSGTISAWAWRKQARILRNKQAKDMADLKRRQKNYDYLEELKRKL